MENEKIEKIEKSLAAIDKKESKVMFFITQPATPSASIYEIYRHATTLKNLGYNVVMVSDDSEYEIPSWVDKELVDMEHKSMNNLKLTVGAQDMLIIPEVLPNVMEQTQNLPCIRVAFVQSIDYALNSMIPATDWRSFGITDVITTSDVLKDLIIELYGDKFNINIIPPTIPEYFNDVNDEIKKPIISIIGRNSNEISKVVKMFYAIYPQYSWIGFDSMLSESKPPKPLARKEFANKLKGNFASVWIDRISSFGTFPLEAMKARSILIGLLPDITPEYLIVEEDGEFKLNVDSGFWTNDIYTLPRLIGDVVTKFIDDSLDEKIFEEMKITSSNYNEDETIKKSIDVFKGLFSNRKEILEKALNNLKEEQKESKDEEK